MLGPGLTALTGETGAGKTMLVEAIELLVGGRADSLVVRHGAAEARVDGRFVSADGTETVVSRVDPCRGRSRAYVNGRLATAARSPRRRPSAVDLHGQHAHQSLLSTATQRAALDEYGEIDLEPLRAARARLTEIDAELAALGGDERARAREIDLLRYPGRRTRRGRRRRPGEDDASTPRSRCSPTRPPIARPGGGAQRWRSPTAPATTSARHSARSTAGPVRRAGRPAARRARRARRRRRRVARHAEAIDESPERLDDVRERARLLSDLAASTAPTSTRSWRSTREASDRLDELERFDQRAAELDDRRGGARAERTAATAVGERRREVAPKLAAGGRGAAARAGDAERGDRRRGGRTRGRPSRRSGALPPGGQPGSPLLPLTRVASGGELARAMLALRLVMSAGDVGDADDTLVFDEVDAGIGGAAAQAVADALAALGAHHQVLVVTHLAQVAAAAATQVAVSKTGRTAATDASARVSTPTSASTRSPGCCRDRRRRRPATTPANCCRPR